jgi:hypothetical protein
MRSKLVSLLLVALLLLASFSTALAQDGVYCGDLSEEDCAILQSAQEAMMSVRSYTSDASYDALVTGLPGLPADGVSVAVNVAGAFEWSDEALAAAGTLAGATQEEVMAALSENPQILGDLVSGLSADVVISYEASQALADELGAQVGIAVPASASIPVIIVDGVFYWDASDFAAWGAYEGWVGMPLAEVVGKLAEAGAFDPTAMEQLASDPTTAAAMVVPAMLLSPDAFSEFIVLERGEDTDVDGQTAAVFTTSFDVAGLLASPMFSDLVTQLVASGAIQGVTPADVEQLLPMLPMVAPMLGLTIDGAQTIGLDDYMVYNTASEIVWDLAGLGQMAAMSGADLGLGADAGLSFTVNVDDADFNADQGIVAPEDAAMLTADQVLGGQ